MRIVLPDYTTILHFRRNRGSLLAEGPGQDNKRPLLWPRLMRFRAGPFLICDFVTQRYLFSNDDHEPKTMTIHYELACVWPQPQDITSIEDNEASQMCPQEPKWTQNRVWRKTTKLKIQASRTSAPRCVHQDDWSMKSVTRLHTGLTGTHGSHFHTFTICFRILHAFDILERSNCHLLNPIKGYFYYETISLW